MSLAACLGLSLSLSAANAATLEVGHGVESVDQGLPAWTESNASLYWDTENKLRLGTIVRSAKRFGLRNTELNATLAAKLGGGWSIDSILIYGGQADFVARHGGGVQLLRSFGDGWGLGGGVLSKAYAKTNVHAFSADLEKYEGPMRLSARVTHARSDTGVIGTSTKLQLDYYFGDIARVGIIGTRGQEVDVTSSRLPIYNVTAAAITALIPIRPNLAIQASVGTHRQGTAYRRTGGRLGVQVDF